MSSPDRLEERSKMGVGRLFGVPFAMVGYGIILAPILAGEYAGVLFSLPFGGIFAAVGTWIIFGQSGWTIDRNSQTICSWWGLLGYRKERTLNLADFDELSISKERRGSQKNRYTCYPVQLRGGTNKYEFGAPRIHHSARAEAERVAKFLEMGIHDRSSGDPVFRALEDLDVTLLDHYKKTGETKEMPTPLEGAKSKLRVEGDSLIFEIPGLSMGCAVVGILFASVFFALPIFMVSFGIAQSMRIEPMLILAILILPLIVWAISRIGKVTKPSFLEISQQGVKLQRQGMTQYIPLDQLEEVEVSGAGHMTRGIAARSDHESIEVSSQLSSEELIWIRDTLHWFIASLARQS